jgi:hypothetical protein
MMISHRRVSERNTQTHNIIYHYSYAHAAAAAAAQGSEIEEGVRCVQHSTAQQVTGGCA